MKHEVRFASRGLVLFERKIEDQSLDKKAKFK